MAYSLTVAPGTAEEQSFDADDLRFVDFSRTHTGVGNYQARVPFEPSLEDRLYREVHLEHDSEFLFRGFLETVMTDEQAGETTVSGRGIAYELKNGESSSTYSSIPAHRAIWDYWARYWWPTALEDGFEDGNISGWAGTTGYFSAERQDPYEGAYHGTLDTSGAAFEANVYLDTTTGGNGTGARFYAQVPTTDTVRFALITPSEDAPVRVRANAGSWEYYSETASAWRDAGVAVSGDYQRLDLLADEAADTFSLYIAGETVGRELATAGNATDLKLELAADPGNVARIDSIDLLAENVDVVAPSANTRVSGEEAQDAPSADAFADILDVPDTRPMFADAGRLKLAQTSKFQEGENGSGGFGTRSDSDYSGGTAATLADVSESTQFSYTPEYRVPGAQVAVGLRIDARNGHNGFDIVVDGEVMESIGTDLLSNNLRWYNSIFGISSDLQAGESVTVKIDCTDAVGDDDVVVDGFNVYDNRYSYDFDDSVHVADGYLDGPQDYPPSVVARFIEVTTPWNITAGDLAATLADATETPNALQARLSGQTWFPNDGSEQDTESVSTEFGNESGTNIQGRVDLGRRDVTRDTETPRTGFEGQEVTDWDLLYDGNDVALIEQKTFEGDHLRNLIRLHEFASMRFSMEHEPDARGATSFRSGDATRNDLDVTIRNRARTVSGRGYANEVTVRGQTDPETGERPTRTIRDEAAISAVGMVVHADVTDPSLSTQADVNSAARSELGDRVTADERKGKLEVVSTSVRPGFTYPVTWFDGTTDEVPLEEVTYAEREGAARGVLRFDLDPSLVDAVAALRGDTDRNTDAL
jgi:hypothetical protein